jgi:hypothetical protein
MLWQLSCAWATSGRTALIVTHRPEQISGLPEIRLSPAAVQDPCNAAGADANNVQMTALGLIAS